MMYFLLVLTDKYKKFLFKIVAKFLQIKNRNPVKVLRFFGIKGLVIA